MRVFGAGAIASTWGPVACALLLLAAGGERAAAQVELRGQMRAVDGEITLVDIKGVQVRITANDGGGATTRLIGWDRIRRVNGPMAGDAAKFAELADGLWRARARLERRDVRAAELLFDALYARHVGLAGPGGAVLAEGVMRTRLLRGATATAIWPWLDWLQIRYASGKKDMDSWMGGKIALPEAIDQARGLVPRLPPIFSTQIDSTGVRLLAEVGGGSPWHRFESADDAVRDIAAIYRTAAMFELNPSQAVDLPAIRTTEDQVVLLADIVRARVGGEQERKEARGRLSRRLSTLAIGADDLDAEPTANQSAADRYLESWCRVAIGRSLVREGDPTEVRQGLIEMLHAPARFADVTPELAHLALLDAAGVLSRMGDSAGAKVLEDEAKRRYGPGARDEWQIMDESAEPGTAGDALPAPEDEQEQGAGG
jgi:hypothetical protein